MNHSINTVIIPLSIGQAFDHQHTDALARENAIRRRRERTHHLAP